MRQFLTCATGAALTALASLALMIPAEGHAQERRAFDIVIENRHLLSPEQIMRVSEGDQVELRYSSDESVELHLHGYDRTLAIKVNEPGVMVFEATVTGRFPLTVHHWGEHAHTDVGGSGHEALTYLEVYPR